jgi:16S rRNA (cytosine1407-C5)-methyltransferase
LPEISSSISAYIKNIYDEKTAKEYIDYINSRPSQYIRVNRLKTNSIHLSQVLERNYNVNSKAVSTIPYCLKITNGENVTGKTIQHILGEYYIQSLSSMLPPIVLNPDKKDIVLDLCSAPGSKTTQLGEMMHNTGTLISNEISLDRVKMLVFNIDRMNLVNAGVIHYRGELLSKVYPGHFDKILVDAPCSGLGIIQKKNEVNDWWSLKRISVLGELQLRLLIAAIKMVKEGGEIVYSTCTLTIEENEFIIDKVLEKYPVEIVDIDLPVLSHEAFTNFNGKSLNPALSKARRVLPWEVDSEGFFIVKLRKNGKTDSLPADLDSKQNFELLDFSNKEIQKYAKNILDEFSVNVEKLSKYKYLIKGNDIFFINNKWSEKNLNIFERIGTRFGTIVKNNYTVLHTQSAQILNNDINTNIYIIQNEKELKTYFEGGIINRRPDIKNQCVVKYEDSVLGTAVITNQGVKSRFPRAKRTQEILIKA